jgi:hypothetical protein
MHTDCLGTTGDSNGNLSWGFSREGAILFPEVEINYDVSLSGESLRTEADL